MKHMSEVCIKQHTATSGADAIWNDLLCMQVLIWQGWLSLELKFKT